MSRDTQPIENISVELAHDFEVVNLSVLGTPSFAVGLIGMLVHNESWCELVAASYGKNATKLRELRESVANAWGTVVARTHGYHIVLKDGGHLAAGVKLVNDHSKTLLTRFEVELAITKAGARDAITASGRIYNLVIAPYRYVHSAAAINSVNNRLRNALDSVNLNTPAVPATLRSKTLSNLSDAEVSQLKASAYSVWEEGQLAVKDALVAIRLRLETGKTL